MAQEQQPVQSLFLPEYPVPDNQLMAELELVETYSAAFSQSDLLIKDALRNLGKVAGTHASAAIETADDEDENEPAQAWDEAKLLITMPVVENDFGFTYPTREELQENHSADGHSVRGTLPPHSIALLRGLYGLIGAETIRDDRAAEETDGVIVRRGSYQGQTVYAVEQFESDSGDPANDSYSVLLCSEDGISRYWNQLAASQREYFLEVSGVRPSRYAAAVDAHGITPDNYEQIAEDLARLRSETRRLGRKPLADEVELALDITKAAAVLPFEAGKLCVGRMLSPFKRYWEGKSDS